MSTYDESGWRPRAALHLLWTVPLAIGMSFIALFWMVLNWCGVSGCSGGGFGRISNPSLPAVLFGGVLMGMSWFVALAVVPWHRRRGLRMALSAAVAVVLAVLGMLYATAGFVR